MNAERDPVDEALDLLRSDDRLELAPPFQEHGSRRRVRRRPRLLPSLLAAAALAGAAAAGGGLEALRTWWYRIRVDDAELAGVVEGNGEVRSEFVTEDGCRVVVTVASASSPDEESTRIEVARSDPRGVSQHEVETRVRRTRSDAESLRGSLPRRALVGGSKLHEWFGPNGERLALYLADHPDGPGSRLLLHAVESDADHPVTVLGDTGRRLTRGATTLVTEHPGGLVTVTVDEGNGVELELVIGAPPPPDTPTEYRSRDGRVRVEAGG